MLDAAIDGRGSVVLVSGDPGIGKTRFIREIAEECSSRAFQAFWGRCWEAGGAPAFWPWIEVIREYTAGIDDAALIADLGTHAPRVASLVPELAGRLGVAPEPM